MAVHRVHKNADYTVMANYHLRDKNMTLKTKGLLSLILSLPDDWDYSTAGLISIVKDGTSSVNTALREMEALGYLRRTRIIGANGRVVDWQYDIYEKPLVEKPQVENPQVEKPHMENRTQLNTYQLSTEEQSTYQPRGETRKRFTPPTLEEVSAYCKERNNGISAESFVDYYTARGWRLGKETMRDWKAAVRTWENRRKEDKKPKVERDYGDPEDFYK